jgi:hypothetical protein
VYAKVKVANRSTQVCSAQCALHSVGDGAAWFFEETAAWTIARGEIDARMEMAILGHEMPSIIDVVFVRAKFVINNARERIAPTLGDMQVQENSIRSHFFCFLLSLMAIWAALLGQRPFEHARDHLAGVEVLLG